MLSEPSISRIRTYDLHDPAQYADEKEYWDAQTISFKLEVLEQLRASVGKLINKAAENDQITGFRRVLRTSERS